MNGKNIILGYLRNKNTNAKDSFQEVVSLTEGNDVVLNPPTQILYPLHINDIPTPTTYVSEENYYLQGEDYNITIDPVGYSEVNLTGTIAYTKSKFYSIFNSFTYLRENVTLKAHEYKDNDIVVDEEEYPFQFDVSFPVSQIIVQSEKELNGLDKMYTFKVYNKDLDGFFYYNFRSPVNILSKVLEDAKSTAFMCEGEGGNSKIIQGNFELLSSPFSMIDLNNPILMGSNYILNEDISDESVFPEDQPSLPPTSSSPSLPPPIPKPTKDYSWVWFLVIAIIIIVVIIIWFIKRHVF